MTVSAPAGPESCLRRWVVGRPPAATLFVGEPNLCELDAFGPVCDWYGEQAAGDRDDAALLNPFLEGHLAGELDRLVQSSHSRRCSRSGVVEGLLHVGLAALTDANERAITGRHETSPWRRGNRHTAPHPAGGVGGPHARAVHQGVEGRFRAGCPTTASTTFRPGSRITRRGCSCRARDLRALGISPEAHKRRRLLPGARPRRRGLRPS
jgi:hypothetical protein